MKAECEQALRDIERYLDGEMPTPEARLVDSHLSGCTPCMQRADFKVHVRELIASRCGCDDVPQSLQDRVAALLDRPPVPPAAGA